MGSDAMAREVTSPRKLLYLGSADPKKRRSQHTKPVHLSFHVAMGDGQSPPSSLSLYEVRVFLFTNGELQSSLLVTDLLPTRSLTFLFNPPARSMFHHTSLMQSKKKSSCAWMYTNLEPTHLPTPHLAGSVNDIDCPLQ